MLIDEVIEPIGKKQVGVAAPYQRRHGVGIIAGEIILREGRMNASGQIPRIFIGQGVAVIFAVTGDKDLPGILGGDNRRAGWGCDDDDTSPPGRPSRCEAWNTRW